MNKYNTFYKRFQTFEQRFWEKVKKAETGCWNWCGGLQDGYGVIHFNKRQRKAHRMSYELAYGPFDPSLFVCHKCDNPSCVNPEHLFLGTPKDNTQDAWKKGRYAKLHDWMRTHPEKLAWGERCPLAKLTEDKVRNIRVLKESGHSAKEIALQFGVSRHAIYSICKRRTWKLA